MDVHINGETIERSIKLNVDVGGAFLPLFSLLILLWYCYCRSFILFVYVCMCVCVCVCSLQS